MHSGCQSVQSASLQSKPIGRFAIVRVTRPACLLVFITVLSLTYEARGRSLEPLTAELAGRSPLLEQKEARPRDGKTLLEIADTVDDDAEIDLRDEAEDWRALGILSAARKNAALVEKTKKGKIKKLGNWEDRDGDPVTTLFKEAIDRAVAVAEDAEVTEDEKLREAEEQDEEVEQVPDAEDDDEVSVFDGMEETVPEKQTMNAQAGQEKPPEESNNPRDPANVKILLWRKQSSRANDLLTVRLTDCPFSSSCCHLSRKRKYGL
eukprot:1175756-Prorocentrum_minimum.AAC.4